MRHVLPLVFLAALASAAPAQVPAAPEAPAKTVTPVVAPATPAESAETAAAVAIDQERVEVTETESAAQDGPRSRSFWYLVGAIVVAGIILALIL